VSIYLAEPQSMHRYFGEVLEKNKERLFKEKNHFIYYYLSALLMNRIEKLFKQRKIKKYKPLKYHLGLLVFKLLMSSKSSQYKEEDMLQSINDSTKLMRLINISMKILENTLTKENIVVQNAKRNKSFTKQILKDVEVVISTTRKKK
jgi:hypothetical protein